MLSNSLTGKERLCLTLLGDFWNAYLELTELHPADRQEASVNVHDLQNRVLARRAVREQQAPEIPADVAELLKGLEWSGLGLGAECGCRREWDGRWDSLSLDEVGLYGNHWKAKKHCPECGGTGTIPRDVWLARCPCCKASHFGLRHENGCKLAEVLGRLP